MEYFLQETDFCTLFVREEMSEYDVPYGSLADLLRFLDGFLDSYDEQNLRKWREGSIREDEIWIKIGGDHGKYSLKFTFQIANTAKPNARHNTVVIAIATVRDTHDNIVRLLEGGLGNDHSSPIVGETRPSKSFSMVTMSLCARCMASQAHKAHIYACGA